MAVGQFFNLDEGKIDFSPLSMLLSIHSHNDIVLEEDHILAFNLSFAICLGLLPVTFSLKTAGCGIKDSELLDEAGDTGNTTLWTCTWMEKTIVLLLLDPHCAYKAIIAVSITTTASRFGLLYFSQVATMGKKTWLFVSSLVYESFFIKGTLSLGVNCFDERSWKLQSHTESGSELL